MIAFASNSLLCRLALKQTGIDAANFTLIRILSGAVALWLIMKLRRATWKEEGSWSSALALFIYAAAFSFAYLDLSAGTGALLLFGAVQATMILWGFRKGERLDAIQMVGLIVAVTGLVVLMFPGLSAPPLIGSILMVGAGVAWGIYSMHGKLARRYRHHRWQFPARRSIRSCGQHYFAFVGASRSDRHLLRRSFRSDHFRTWLRHLVQRIAWLESNECRHGAT